MTENSTDFKNIMSYQDYELYLSLTGYGDGFDVIDENPVHDLMEKFKLQEELYEKSQELNEKPEYEL